MFYPFIAKMKLPVFLSLVFGLWVMEIQKFAKSVLHRKTKTEDLRRTGSWKPSKKSTLRFLSRTRSEPEREDVGIEEEETESWVATLPDLPPMRPRKSPLIAQTLIIGPCTLLGFMRYNSPVHNADKSHVRLLFSSCILPCIMSYEGKYPSPSPLPLPPSTQLLHPLKKKWKSSNDSSDPLQVDLSFDHSHSGILFSKIKCIARFKVSHLSSPDWSTVCVTKLKTFH